MLFDANLIVKTTSTNRIDNNELTVVYTSPQAFSVSIFLIFSFILFVWRCPRGFVSTKKQIITNWGRQSCSFSIFRIKRSQVGNLFKDVNDSSCSEVAWRMIGKSSAMQGTHLSLQYDTCMFFLFLDKRKPLRIEKTQTGRSRPLCMFSFFIRSSSDFVFSLGKTFFKYNIYITKWDFVIFLFSSFFPWKRKKKIIITQCQIYMRLLCCCGLDGRPQDYYIV